MPNRLEVRTMDAHRIVTRLVLLALAVLVIVSMAGCTGGSSNSGSVSTVAPGSVGAPAPATTNESLKAAPDLAGGGSAQSAAPATADRLVVSTDSMFIEVKNLDATVNAIRTLATKYGATISDLSVNAGTQPPTVQPMGTENAGGTSITPGSASVTLRIPVAQLAAAEREAASLGRVISQTAAQSDVTQQHVDMAARLKNLQAEEVRLRQFLNKATKVSDMLAIENELSRVRGDIESMQAQLAYLENQAALATFTISLSEPGALVSPAAGGWGFATAVRNGVRAAAVLAAGLITVLIAVLPLIVLVLVVVFFIRWMVHISRRRKLAAAESASRSEDAGSSEQETVDQTPPL
jgi:hypothetical protein